MKIIVNVGWVDSGNISCIDQESGIDIAKKNGEKKQKLQRKEGQREGQSCKVKSKI